MKGVKMWQEQERKAVMYQEHQAISYKYVSVSSIPGFEPIRAIYKGEDAAEHMLNGLPSSLAKTFYDCITKPKVIICNNTLVGWEHYCGRYCRHWEGGFDWCG